MITSKYLWINGLVGLAVLFAGALSAAAQEDAPVQSPAAAAAPVPANSTPEDAGDALMVHQRYEAAIAAYKSADPNSADVWNKLGIANQLMLNPQEADRCYRKSLQL